MHRPHKRDADAKRDPDAKRYPVVCVETLPGVCDPAATHLYGIQASLKLSCTATMQHAASRTHTAPHETLHARHASHMQSFNFAKALASTMMGLCNPKQPACPATMHEHTLLEQGVHSQSSCALMHASGPCSTTTPRPVATPTHSDVTVLPQNTQPLIAH
jgi:hypothetical protein